MVRYHQMINLTISKVCPSVFGDHINTWRGCRMLKDGRANDVMILLDIS